MDGLKRQRSACKGGLTKIVKFAEELHDGSKVTVDDIKTRISYAKDLLERFHKLEDSILEEDGEESQINEFEDDYLAAVSKLSSTLRKRQALPRQDTSTANDDTLNCTAHQPVNIIKYAKVDIPTFSGDPTEFQSFIDLFNAAVHNIETYTPSQKFQLLKRYLSGEAATLVRHLAITDANYTEAMDRLNHRYDRKKPIIFSFIRKFLSLPKISKATAHSIRSAHDTADEVLRGLKALGDAAESRDWWLIYLLTEKMDDETKSLWAQRVVNNDDLEFSDLLKFLETRVEALDAVNVPTSSFSTKKPTQPTSKSNSFATAARPSETNKSTSCPLCMKEAHRLIDCAKYKVMSIKDRAEHIRSHNRCFNCLNSGHRVIDCGSKSRCAICHRRHHKSLHTDDSTKETDTKPEAVMSTLTQSKEVQSYQSTSTFIAVLPTVMVLVVDNYGIEREFRALLDSGSQASFITESCSQKLGLKRTNSRMLITGIGNTPSGVSRGVVTICIKPKLKDRNHEIIVNALVIPKIAAKLPELLNRDDLKWLSTVQLADSRCHQSRSIDILLGSDVFFEMLDEGQLKSPNSKLVAQNTKFGWVIGGSAAVKFSEIQTHCTILDIDNTLRKFWEIEDVDHPKQSQLSTEEKVCIKHYEENTTRLEDGRFVTRLPFKSDPSKLPNNFQSAFSQLHSLERRLAREPELHQLYDEFLKEYSDLGHMKRVDGPVNSSGYYLPHHGVLKEQNTTTKLRVVFNASSKIGENPSLNNLLMTGPTVQSTLWSILLRFRLYKYVFTADVEKMYRQVLVHELDQPYQTILWRDEKGNICAYQLTTVTYGTSSAPFVATHTLNKLASNFYQDHPHAARTIQEDVYVDDVLKGARTVEELVTLKKDICAILQSGQFNLRKFVSNHADLHDPSSLPTNSKLLDEHKDTVKVLGIRWDPIQDAFIFSTNFPPRKTHTKRSILSEASRVFDPYGWLSPLLIRSKIILQELWRSNVNWDDSLPTEILNNWLKLRQEIEDAKFIEIRRWLKSSFNADEELEIHGFSDASQKAYSAVVFLRVLTSSNISCQIVSSKTKVAPLKIVSLPRLELLGAELLANHVQTVINECKLKPTRITLWTDSKIVLDWLSSQPRRWATFVANRVGKITSVFNRSLWRHIPSQLNPADCASRGISVDELKNHPLWWTGPHFLSQSMQDWPSQLNLDVPTPHEEKSVNISSTITMTNDNENTLKDVTTNDTIDYLFSKFSSYNKMLRIGSYIRRVFTIVKPKSIMLTVDEINDIEAILCREVQRNKFSNEYSNLLHSLPLSNKSKLLQYSPFLDDDGVMRVGGRIKNSLAPYNTKHPIILSAKWSISHKIMHQIHRDNCHPGPSLLLAMIQEKYCIIGVRNLLRFTFRRCIGCIKQNPRLEKQIMGSLPIERVNMSAPFACVGVDFAGPLRVHTIRRRGAVPETKAYLCVFICMSTRAIHLELCMQLTTKSFLAALKRFVGRRGLCHTIFCDNGTNFVGAANFLKELQNFFDTNQQIIANKLMNERINFKFNPPGAPHMGGLWESAVRLAKVHLHRTIGEQILTVEEFNTLIIEIESALNTRPLCSSLSPTELVLTPSHFILHRASQQVPDIINENDLSLNDRWDMVRRITLHFWYRWQREYLVTLQSRSKWRQSHPNLQENDVVIISEPNLPPGKWMLGRIIHVFAGSDGKVRVVKIKTSCGTVLERPISKVCKLPVNESTDSWPAGCSGSKDVSALEENKQ